jgi:hypothetical protein
MNGDVLPSPLIETEPYAPLPTMQDMTNRVYPNRYEWADHVINQVNIPGDGRSRLAEAMGGRIRERLQEGGLSQTALPPVNPLQQEVDRLKKALADQTSRTEMYRDAVHRLWEQDPSFVELCITSLGDNKLPDGSENKMTFEDVIRKFATRRFNEYVLGVLKTDLERNTT